jgi:diphosphomevalonate decarboxylase
MTKATAKAPSNIAFVKYWGKKDEALRLPENGSLSMNLSDLTTTTTVQFSEELNEDSVTINGIADAGEISAVTRHLDRIRKLAQSALHAKVVSINSFPAGTGLSSSASGFAALTVAAAKAAGLEYTQKDLSILARQGSGSACRSIPDGFVEWLDGDASETSYALSLYPSSWWDIADVVAVVNLGKKDISTTKGMSLAPSSPFHETRLYNMYKKIALAKDLLAKRDFTAFGELAEREALEMHAVMLTSKPALIYWTPGTLRVMKLVHKWRGEGLEVYFTINTGQDIHLIVQGRDVDGLKHKLSDIDDVRSVIVNRPADGTRLIENHLF